MYNIDSYNYKRDNSPLHNKSYEFAVRIVRMSRRIHLKPQEYSLLNQLLRSATAIGALVREAEYAQSTADFINKMSIALKEANETTYWLHIFNDCELMETSWFDSLKTDCNELIAILIASIKTAKERKQPE